jgi:TP901 family phage tail tape measure protein
MAADAESTIRIGIDTTEALASIKNLQRQISAFHAQLQSSGNAANAAISQNLQRGLINNLNATGQFAASLTNVKSSAESFTTALERNKLSMGEYFRFAGASSRTFGRLFKSEFDTIEKVARERVKTINTQFIKMGRDANGAITAIKVRPLVADLDSLAGRQAIAAQRQQVFNQLLKQGSTNLLNFGKNTQWAGRQLMVGFTIPLAYLGTVAGKTFMKMEEQAIRFKRVYGELFTTQDETDAMVKEIQTLAKEFTKYGIAVEKTMELAADAAAMGQMGEGLKAQVAEATRLAVLGGVEQAEALKTTISLTDAFGVSVEELAKKTDFLNAVENQTVVSIEDLTIAIPKAGPVVKQLGGDVEDLAFFLTAMKEGGINASEGANALKSGLASLINPAEKSAKFLGDLGINIKAIVEGNAGDIKGTVIGFANALDTLDPLNRARAIEQLFGKFQFSRLSTLFQNVVAEGTQAERVLKLTRASTEELAILSERELKRVEDSTGYKFKKAMEDLRAALVPLGEQFLKIVTPIAEFATKALEQFNKLSDGTKSVVTTIVTLLGGVGPVALMTFGLINNGIANGIKLFNSIRMVFARLSGAATGTGTSVSYMTQEQLEANAVAASLNQTHAQLIQTFTLEATSINSLTTAYQKAIAAQAKFNTAAVARGPAAARGVKPKGYNSGVLSVPGPKGAGDIIPAMLAPGEAVIPADAATKYRGFIADMIAGKIPGFFKGFLGMPRSGKSTQKNREAATEIYGNFKQSRLRDQEPEVYGHQITPTTGHSFPLFGVGGVYAKRDGSRVFVKPVLDEKAAIAEVRATEIARKVHGLEAPEQRIVVMRDPTDITRQRKFIALESKLNPNLVNDNPVAQFTQEQYFKQLVASLVRTDKDLSASNLFGNVLADVGPAGVFPKASGLRDFTADLPSMEQQAMINLLGVKGGAKKAFAESTVGLMANLTPKQYHDNMIAEIKKVLPRLRKTVDSFEFSSPEEALAYTNMVKRLEDGLGVDWSKFHAIHSAVKPAIPKQTSAVIPGYKDGVLRVPGPKGAGDVMPAMLAPGEAVIPAKTAEKYRGFISAMIAGKIPGFFEGLENASQSAKTKIEAFGKKYKDVEGAEARIQSVINEMNAEGTSINWASFDRAIEEKTGKYFKLADKTSFVNPISGDGSSLTGLNATHGNRPIPLSSKQLSDASESVGRDTPIGKKLAASSLSENKSTALSNMVFNMPSAFNMQDTMLTGKEAALFVRKNAKLFMEPITNMYSSTIAGLDADDLGVKQFAKSVADKMKAAGNKAITEDMFYKIISESVEDLRTANPNSPSLKALEAARGDFKSMMLGSEKSGRRDAMVGDNSFDDRGRVVQRRNVPSYLGRRRQFITESGNKIADKFVQRILAAATAVGFYKPQIEEQAQAKEAVKTAKATVKKTAPKAPKVEKSEGRSKSRQIKPKKFPGGFDINRVSSVIDKRGTFRYFYLDENGKKVPLAMVDYSKALGLDPKRIRELEQMGLAEAAQESAMPKTAPRATGGRFGKALGIGALAVGGVAGASAMMPQGGQQQEGGGIDLMTGAIVASTVLSIPMMFGKTIQDVFGLVKQFAGRLGPVGKTIAVLAGALGAATPFIIKAFTPLKDTEEYTKAFNDGLVNNRAQLDAIANTFGRVSSADIFERVRQNKFTPLSFAPGQTPFGDTFAASEQGKVFIEEYKQALANSGSTAAVQKLSQELSFSVISGIFTVDQARSIAMTIGQQLEDMSIGLNVSANITGLLGPEGKNLESQTGDVLSRIITQSGQPLQELLEGSGPSEFTKEVNDYTRRMKMNNEKAGEDFKNAIPGSDFVADTVTGFRNFLVDLEQDALTFTDPNRALDAAETGTLVAATMSTIEAGRQSLATFELIYDEKEATVQKEIEHAKAIKDTAAEAKAIEKLEGLQTKRAEQRARLQEAFAKQLQATQDIYTRTTSQGRSDILGGFMDQFTNLYKDTPMAAVATSIKEDLERLKDNPFVVNIAAALATGAIKPESFNALLMGLEDKKLETDILANVSSVVKTQGTQAGGELINLLNKFSGRSDLQYTLTMLVQQDASNLDVFSLLATLPGGGDAMEFYLDPKINPDNLKDLNTLKGNLDQVDELIKTGDFDMENLLKLDLDVDDAAFAELKENAEYFNKLPKEQKKVFTSVFLSVLPTITDDQINAEIDRRASDIRNPNAADQFANYRKNLVAADSNERAKIAAKLAADYAESLLDYLDLTDNTTGAPKTPTGDGKKQTSFLDGLVKRIRDMAKSTQKLTSGWSASAEAVRNFYKELASGEADDQRGLSQRLREAGVAESLIPGLMDLKTTDPKEFEKLFIGGKIAGGLNELGQATNRITILTDAISSFGEAQSKAARQSIQQRVAIDRLVGSGVSYSDALEMVQDESLLAMAASGGFNDELKAQIDLFRQAKAAAANTYQGMTDEFNEAFAGVMERFSAEESRIRIKLEIDTAADQKIIAEVQEQIALINDQNDDLDYGLSLIAEQEESINKEYDDRIEALDEVERANKRIASLQQRQISLAQAISEGDVFAAAKAMQELEAANAEAFAVDARDMLDREKVAKLEQSTAEVIVDGQKKKLTRLEIEELIKKNLKQIAQIEEEQLEPAERRVRIATALAAAEERRLTIVGLTRAQWEEQANKIELASTSAVSYDGKLALVLASVNKIVAAWVAVKEAQDAANRGVGGAAGGSNVVPQEKPLMSKEEAKALADKLTATDLPAAIAAKAGLGNIEERINNANTYARNMAAAGKMVEAKSALNTRDTLMGTLNAANARIQAVIDQISGLKRDFNKDIVVPEVTVAPFTLPPVTVTPPDDKKPDPKPDPKKDPKDDPKPDPKDDPKKDPKPTSVNTTTIEGILAASGIIPAVKPGSGGSSGTAWIPMATGGFVSGPGTATSDSIPALLSNGEYVINAKTAGSIGIDMLDAINFGKVPAFARGGAVNTNTLAGIAAASKKPTVAELLAAAKKQDNKVVNKTLAAKAAPKPTSGGTSAVVKAKTGEVPGLPSQQMLDRGRAGEQTLADLPALFLPVLGNVLSANAMVGSLERKDYLMATLDAIGVIPGFGNIVKGVAKSVDTAIATKLAEKTLSNPKINIAFPSRDTKKILNEGFSSQFDPTKKTDGMRLAVEDRLGFPTNTPASGRPVYGAIQNRFNVPESILKRIPGVTGDFLRATDPRTNALLKMYGGSEPAFASLNSKNLQGTYTLGDSFGNYRTQMTLGVGAGGRARDLIRTLKRTPLPYLEAQLNPLMNSSAGATQIKASIEEISKISTRKNFRDVLSGFSNRLIPGRTPRVTTTPITTRTSTRADFGEIVDVFNFGRGKKQVVFQGPEQDFSSMANMGIQVVKPTPQGLLSAAMRNNPLSLNNLKLKSMINNFDKGVIGKNETNLLDSMAASAKSGDNGLATLLNGLSGNRAAAAQVGLRTQSFVDHIENVTKAGYDLGPIDGSVANPRKVPAIHSTKYPIVRDKDGKIVLRPSGAYDATNARSSVHWTLGGTVQSHMFGKWDGVNKKIVTPLSSLMRSGTLDNLNPIDTWVLKNPGKALKLDDASVISPFTDVSAYQKELLNRGLMRDGKLAPLMAVDNSTKEVLHILRKSGEYTSVDRIQLKQILGHSVKAGEESGAIEEAALKLAKQLVGTDTNTVKIQQWNSSDSILNEEILNLARQQKVNAGIHMDSKAFRLEGPHATMGGAYTGDDAPIEAIRYAMLRGQLKNPTRPDLTSIMGESNRLAMGGLVKPKYFNYGGMVKAYARGGDVVPSMLTPGEFVMSKYAVQNYGVDKMKALNSGTYNGDSVYNYNLSVNVKSDANPDDIARTVMTQIRQVESQRIRSAR